MGVVATVLGYASPSNVLAAAPLVEEGFKLAVEYFLPIRGFPFLEKILESKNLPDKKLHALGSDSMKNLERYVDYAGRIERTSQGSILALVSIFLVEYEHDPQLAHIGWYLVLAALIVGNLLYLWYRLIFERIDAIRSNAGSGHANILLLLSLAIIVLNLQLYPP